MPPVPAPPYSGLWYRAIGALPAVAVKRQYDTAATFALAEDNKMGITKLAPTRLRLLASNGASSSTGPIQYQLQVAETATCASGTYVAVGSDTDWQMVDSTYYGDGAATSNVTSGLTDPGGFTFAAGQLKDTSDTTAAISLNASGFTEVEFAVKATSSATSGGNYCFRLYNTTTGAVFSTYTNYAQAQVNGITAINLLSFAATGYGESVRVNWQTAQEVENKGFDLYRATNLAGPYFKLNPKLMATASIGGEGRDYEFFDEVVSRGTIYYYKLEDVDVRGRTPRTDRCAWTGTGTGFRTTGRLPTG